MKKKAMPELPCICANLRRASRVVTQKYDEALRPHGLRATQFTVLQALSLVGEVSQGQLGEGPRDGQHHSHPDPGHHVQRGLGDKAAREDRREWRLRLSKDGEAQLKRALLSWNEVQERLRRRLGSGRTDTLVRSINQVISAVTE